MADALVSTVLEKLESIALDGIEEETCLIVGVKKEIEILSNTLTTIQSVLHDADNKQMKNKAVKFWLEEFKDISYDAEDILDEWSTRSVIHDEQHPDLNASVIRKVRSDLFSLFSCLKPIVNHHDIGNKIRNLNKRLVGVVEKIQLYDLSEIRSNEQHLPISSALVDVEEIYGCDKDVIMTMLLDESYHGLPHVPIISIVGPGGFGKTTLAQQVLEQTKNLTGVSKFDEHIWVCVSDQNNFEKILIEITAKVKGSTDIADSPLDRLMTSIHGKRFILVLDDVWSHNANDWRPLLPALNNGAMGSRILITTRDEMVADMVDSSKHSLHPLADADCWKLFGRRAFCRRENYLDEFQAIGRAILEKCEGVPLAIVIIASLLYLKTTIQEWRDALTSNTWDAGEDGVSVLSSILLSYYALPSYLKPCLMYFAVFPKNAIIKKNEMIQLWMAQGYLGSDDDGSEDLENRGSVYFDNLLMLSFLQGFQRENKIDITSYKMHGVVHDFVQFISKTETIVFEKEELFNCIKLRHIHAQNFNWSSIYQNKKFRTLRLFSTTSYESTLDFLHHLKCLRVLCLRGYQFEELPSEVDQLLQLRYLDLSHNAKLKIFPETICNLVNLQTLKLNYCREFEFKECMGKLSKLRCLRGKGTSLGDCLPSSGGVVRYFPPWIGELSCLRRFDHPIKVIIDAPKNNEGRVFGDLRLLNYLEGSLEISGLGQVTDESNAARAGLHSKEKLVSLVLEFDSKQEKEDELGMMARILEALRPHTNLKELTIRNYQGFWLPSWISSLSNLTDLTLKDLPHLQLSALGNLVSLKFLNLRGLMSVKSLGGREFCAIDNRPVIFPELLILSLSSMPNLEELDLAFQFGVVFFPRFYGIKITDFLPNFRKLRLGWMPALWDVRDLEKLNSLETLELFSVDCSKYRFDDFMNISTSLRTNRVAFPALKNLCLFGMTGWRDSYNYIDDKSIMPRLCTLSIHNPANVYSFLHVLPHTEGIKYTNMPTIDTDST